MANLKKGSRLGGAIPKSSRTENSITKKTRVESTSAKGTRITGATREKLAADLKKKYEKGASIRALAESTGRSYGLIQRILAESGTKVRTGASKNVKPQTRSAKKENGKRLKSRQPARGKIGISEARATAHRLVDALPEHKIPAVLDLLRREINGDDLAQARKLSFIGAFHSGAHDVAAKSSEILRRELGNKER